MKRWYALALLVTVVLVAVAYFKRTEVSGYVRFRVERLIGPILAGVLDRDAKNLDRARQRIATQETARFIIKNMPAVASFETKFELLQHSLQNVDPELKGRYCEFGVYTGGTINFIASQTDEIVHGFDSFEGLPHDWRPGFPAGAFRMGGLPQVRDNVALHKGWFNDSLPGFKETYPGPASFIHLDADLYSSTKSVFEIFGDRIVAGTVIQFDEFFNYPGWQAGEYQAFMEFVDARKVQFEYLGYCGGLGEQVSVKIQEVAKVP